ncbi:MAG: hypothetical protein ABJF23_27000 [Bryobacteraceae bacterium]
MLPADLTIRPESDLGSAVRRVSIEGHSLFKRWAFGLPVRDVFMHSRGSR